ncbi:MAG: hypothetical protein ACK56I_05560 [bacterium]
MRCKPHASDESDTVFIDFVFNKYLVAFGTLVLLLSVATKFSLPTSRDSDPREIESNVYDSYPKFEVPGGNEFLAKGFGTSFKQITELERDIANRNPEPIVMRIDPEAPFQNVEDVRKVFSKRGFEVLIEFNREKPGKIP